MVQGGSLGYATAPHTAAPATRLSQRRDLPPRVRNILTAVLGLCSGKLLRLVGGTLDEFEQELSKQAAKAVSKEQRQRCFESLRLVKRTRVDAGPRFLAAIENALARFDQDKHRGDDDGLPAGEELSLMEAGDLEESLALQEIAAKSEIRQSQMLHDLGHRFAVLAAQPAFDVDRVPLGPAQVVGALRAASTGLNIPAEHRILLYLTFDRVVLSGIGTFYAALNTFLVEHRILRYLRVHAPQRKKSKSTERPGDDAAADQGSPAGTGTVPEQLARAPGDDNDPLLYATLRELLAGKRRALGVAPAKPMGAGYAPTADELQSVLSRLAFKPTTAATIDGKVVQRSVRQLQQELLKDLHKLAPPGQEPRLSGEDSDTIDLVGMLLDHIAKSAPASGSTQTMLTKLQVPLLRVALRDKSFFTQRSHPARLLLNVMAETGIHWIDDKEGQPDPTLHKKMHQTIERLNNEFDGDLSLIERMFGDMSQHMQNLARKAEVTERRLVNASKGREKLAIARETAGNAIAERIAAGKPGRLLRTMLEQAWTDVLALTLLRQGENSDTYKRQLSVADQLIAAGGARGAGKAPDVALRREVEKGLGQVGFHPDEIHAVASHLLASDEAANEEEPTSQTAIAIRLKGKAHLGGTAFEERVLQAKAQRKSLQLDAAEEQMLKRLKTVPFGTWFEFAVNQQGDRVRRKLSWYSTVTGHCLFVNQRGARSHERSLEQLARDVVKGQANIAEPEQGSLVDRAWKAIVTSLKQLTAREAGSRPAPA